MNRTLRTSSVKSTISNRDLKRPALLSDSSSAPSMSVKVDPSYVLRLLQATLLAASKIAVRAKVDLLLTIGVDDDDEEEGMFVAGSDVGSAECSESDRERDCLSVLIVDSFREEERSSTSIDVNE